MMLSPSTVTFVGIAARPGKVIVHPSVLDVAVRTYLVGVVSPLIGTAFMFHLPATSARLTVPGAAAEVVDAVEEAIAPEVSIAAFSFFAHPARTAALQQNAMRVVRYSVTIYPPCQIYGRLWLGAMPSPPNVLRTRVACKSAESYLFLTSLNAARSSLVMRFDE